ncbi:MAG: tannase/feruloyl esterase family alpha/beta hydrolase [Candidatus Acidiferrum sp.]
MKKIFVVAVVTAFLSCACFGQKNEVMAASCERLAKVVLPNAKITLALQVAGGTFTPMTPVTQWMGSDAALYKALPAFCRVVIEAQPSTDSDIKIEVWLPVSGWNGKFQGRGNGGFAGEIDYHSLALAVHEGYATAGTDTGHAAAGTDARWALGHPEKITDYGFRAIHEMTETAKIVIKNFYASRLQHSYFASCSNGGRQALMEAQRFPADYDGIIAGAPANFWTHLLTSAVWDAQATTSDEASYIPSSKLPAIARAVNDACDAQDGVTDGILNDPRKCHFDPATILCKTGDSDNCLTAPQVTALKKLYEGAHDSQGGRIFPGLLPGAEEGPGGWSLWITGQAPGKSLLFAFGNGFYGDMVYDKADWSYLGVDLGEAVKAADAKMAKTLNATETNLAAFKTRGGKLIMYHGWEDPAISPLNSIDYYHGVVATMGRESSDAFVRLYMAPGMQHCAGGPGPDSFGENGPSPTAKDAHHSAQLAIEQWVEKGVAPADIIATKYEGRGATGEVKMTRPLCPYPQTAKYNGSGDSNDAASFVCVADSE